MGNRQPKEENKEKSLEYLIPPLFYEPQYILLDSSKKKPEEELKPEDFEYATPALDPKYTTLQPYSTNNILVEFKEKKKGPTQNILYIPGYMSFKLKNINQIDLQNLSASVNGNLIFTIYYGDLKELGEYFVEKLQKEFVLMFQQDDPIKLSEKNDDDSKALNIKTTVDEDGKFITFTVRKIFTCKINPEVYLTPFELNKLVLSITVQSAKIDMNDEIRENEKESYKYGKKVKKTTDFKLPIYTVKVNLQDRINIGAKIQFCTDTTFGVYKLAFSKLKTCYNNDHQPKFDYNNFDKDHKVDIKRKQKSEEDKEKDKEKDKSDAKSKHKKCDHYIIHEQTLNEEMNYTSCTLFQKNEQKSQKVCYFQNAHFQFSIYKFPSVALATIFIPLWLLGLINLFIFFQTPTLDGRLATIATLMIAFVALIPTIRGSLPSTPTITFVQILVYLQALSSMLCLINSFTIRSTTADSFVMDPSTNWFFIIAVIINVFNVASILTLFVLHKLFWERRYEHTCSANDQQKIDKKNIMLWTNRACDQHFKEYRASVKLYNKKKFKYGSLEPLKSTQTYDKTKIEAESKKKKQEENKKQE